MVTPARLAEIAASMGEPARSAMLIALMDGRALTASELSRVAGVTPQTASAHLARLAGAGLIVIEKQGRHRYHRLADGGVAGLLESMMHVAGGQSAPARVGPRDAKLRHARTCYDHLAGTLGVAILDGLIRLEAVEVDHDAARMTEAGQARLAAAGLVLPDTGKGALRRPLCRPCLDWSERRYHLAGQTGAAICRHALENTWIRAVPGSRAVDLTPKGRDGFRQIFGARL